MYKYCSTMDEGLGRYRANYKQAFAEHMRGGAKTKDKGLLRDDKRINSHCELRSQRVRTALSR